VHDIRLRRFILRTIMSGLLVAGCGGSTGHEAPTCPADPRLGVYDPTRLEVRQQCLWFRGTVSDISPRDDGDLHLDLVPAAGYDRYLNDGNRKDQDGAMVVEIMPGQDFPRPSVGEQVAVYGTWVHDTHNDWNEIHPVWTIDYLERDSRVTSLPPRNPEYDGSADD
jgi:hypothetical protein